MADPVTILFLGANPDGSARLRLDREVREIRRALEQASNNQTRAAEILGTTRRILKYKIDKLGIDCDDAE